MLAEARVEVGVADHKASMLLAGLGVGYGALLAGVIAGSWQPDDLAAGYRGLWWVGAAFSSAAIVAAALAVWPRWDPTGAEGGIHYWGHVATVEDYEAYVAALDEQAMSESERTRRQLWELSRIVAMKYGWVRRSFCLVGMSVPPLVIAALWG